jgi:DNA-binding NtrC family response regulator
VTVGSHILVVDDDADLRRVLTQALEMDGHQVSQAGDLARALALLQEHVFQVVLCDLRLPDGSGMEVLGYLQEHSPHTEVIVITGFGTVDTAVEAMRRGAFDYHQKPLNLEHLLLTVNRALEKATLRHALDYLRHEQPYLYQLEHIVAVSEGMRRVIKQVARVAPTDVTVLLTGETGTGKSLIAGAIHANSPRRDGTLVTVNCAALTETLLESELFGHEKGAFTGAHKARAGRFQQAHGGTLFLDEVGDMSPATQAKVLRAIEEKVIQRVGGTRSIHVDVRIIAATNRDLARAVEEGRFRRDLYYRLNVAPIHLPPLRERREDILPLAERFLQAFCRQTGSPLRPFSPEARQRLVEHPWPGNIRELRNAVERAVLFAPGPEITPEDLGLEDKGSPAEPLPVPDTLELAKLERWAIETALARSDWVQSRAARLLGISPRALSYKLDKLGIHHPRLDARRRRRG